MNVKAREVKLKKERRYKASELSLHCDTDMTRLKLLYSKELKSLTGGGAGQAFGFPSCCRICMKPLRVLVRKMHKLRL